MTKYIKTILAILLIATIAISGCLTEADTAKTAAVVEIGEKYELNTEMNVTPEEIEYKIVGLTIRQGNTDIIEGISELIVTINGGEDYETLTEIEVFVNDISLGTYLSEYQTDYEVKCDIIGAWNVRIDGTFTDGTTQPLIETSGFSLQELKDTPDIAAFEERYIEVSDDQMSKEDAKKFCEENGIIWGCD